MNVSSGAEAVHFVATRFPESATTILLRSRKWNVYIYIIIYIVVASFQFAYIDCGFPWFSLSEVLVGANKTVLGSRFLVPDSAMGIRQDTPKETWEPRTGI